jgi:DNA-directed RNA polymerase subunit F
MTAQERYEIVERVAKLPPEEQLQLIEELVRSLRRASVDRLAVERTMDEMAADPGMQRVLRNEDVGDSQPGSLVKPNVAG